MKNPQAIVETTLQHQKVTGLCAPRAWLRKNEVLHNGNINRKCYRRATINDFFVPDFGGSLMRTIFGLKKSALCVKQSRETIYLLKENSNECIILRCGLVVCPPRLSDLIPLNFFFAVLCEVACLHK